MASHVTTKPTSSSDSNDFSDLDYWKQLPVDQQPSYLDNEKKNDVISQLENFPPLVFAGEVDQMKEKLAQAAEGKAFLLQGGDCAETFEGATADKISARIKTILQMAIVLTYGASMPVIKVGRMAGQFTKPRSSDTETRDGMTLPAYRGDMVNGYEFTEESRRHDPQRMIDGYHTAASTLNLARSFTQGGFADLNSVNSWNKGFAANPHHKQYEELADDISKTLDFMEAAGVDFEALRKTDFFVSHEALLMDYERALTRIDSRTGQPYDTSSHFLWIGERTRGLDDGHVDFLSRVKNPIGVKLGPNTTKEDVVSLIKKLNPDNEPGRLTFITRMGAGNIRQKLPELIEAVEEIGAKVVWSCDPMHGNTVTSSNGYKTRNFDDVVDEMKGFFEVHQRMGTHAGGLHIEMTGDDVAECLGGSDPIAQEEFLTRYESLCDPRLNHQQSLEVAFLAADALAKSASQNKTGNVSTDNLHTTS